MGFENYLEEQIYWGSAGYIYALLRMGHWGIHLWKLLYKEQKWIYCQVHKLFY
jgi:hypothetical protein